MPYFSVLSGLYKALGAIDLLLNSNFFQFFYVMETLFLSNYTDQKKLNF